MQDFVDILIKRIESDPNLTDAGLAKRAGLDNSTIRQMIKHRRSPRIDTAMKICRALGETIEEFMSLGRDPVISEILFHLEQLTPEELRLIQAAAQGMRAQRTEEEK